MTSLIKLNINKLKTLLKKNKVEKAYVFGSALSKNFNEDSDIDFLVKFQDDLEPLEKGIKWWDLHDSLRELFKREIDIVTISSLKNPYFIEEINNTKKLVYG